ncbi:MAG: hypothetical protein AAF215_27560 [Cyanobacteria bacterium P01_A01_bin.123]
MALPKIVQRDNVRVFNFYREQALHEGMIYRGKLYRLLRVFPSDQRLQASALGCKLGSNVVITVSEVAFQVWGDWQIDLPWTPKLKLQPSSPATDNNDISQPLRCVPTA